MAHRWGMVIDQDKCVGCWTCAVGCKAINDEPLGYWWNRVLTTEPDSSAGARSPVTPAIDVPHGTFPNLDLAYLPIACQHCNNAPCEKVCPVGATFRREDGVILIDYNRCIGCRYCLAACPYGVRIFNWGPGERVPDFVIGYGKPYYTEDKLVFEPVRPTGVMEKCTLCVERIDGGEEPFCVEVCPVGARVFGDLEDPTSEVSTLVNEQGAEQLLSQYGTDPNIYYLPVRHPNKVAE